MTGNVLDSATFPMKAEAKLSLAGARLRSQVYRSCRQLSLLLHPAVIQRKTRHGGSWQNCLS